MFTSSIKREIRHVHVAVEQKLERNVQKSVMHVRSCGLLVKPIVFLTFLLWSASLDVKVPIIACGTRKLGNFSLWNPESLAAWNPQYHSRNPESNKRLLSRIQFPLTKTGIQFLESRIYRVESRIQDCLGFPYIGRKSLSRVK